MEFGEALPVDDNGVPLEHLLTCVSNVQLKYGGPNRNIKYIVRDIKTGESEEDNVLRSVPPSLVASINLFCRCENKLFLLCFKSLTKDNLSSLTAMLFA